MDTFEYSDQHSPIILNWQDRSFDFKEEYIVAIGGDLNSQLLEIIPDSNSYDGIDLLGMNVYADYLTDWSLDGTELSQGSILLPSPIEDKDKLKYQWVLDQRQTLKKSKVRFGLTFQMEKEYDSNLFVLFSPENDVWEANKWFVILNYTPQMAPANYLLALVKCRSEFETYSRLGKPMLTIGDDENDECFEVLTEEPVNWGVNYKYYYIKNNNRYEKIVDNLPPAFQKGKYYNRLYVGLSYMPAYALRTKIGTFKVRQGLDVLSDSGVPVEPPGEITFSLADCVSTKKQTLTEAQKKQVQENIGLSNIEDVYATKTELDTKISQYGWYDIIKPWDGSINIALPLTNDEIDIIKTKNYVRLALGSTKFYAYAYVGNRYYSFVSQVSNSGKVVFAVADTTDKILTITANNFISNTDLSTALATKANVSDIYTKDQTYNKTEVNEKIDAALSSVYKPAGSADFAELPTPTKDNLGYVYNVNDAFITDNRFVEGVGKSYPSGTNVVVVEVGEDFKYDVLSGMVDLTDYYTKEQTDSAIDADVKVVTDGLANGTIIPAKATNATNDAKGNVIDTTYATKDELDDKTYVINLESTNLDTDNKFTITDEEIKHIDTNYEHTIISIYDMSAGKVCIFYPTGFVIGVSGAYEYESFNNLKGYKAFYYSQSKLLLVSTKQELATKSSVDTLTTKVNQNTTDIDNKLDKITSTGSTRLYTIGADGSQNIIEYATNKNNTIVQRQNNGNIATSTPIATTDATNKAYVDDAIASQVSSVYKAKGSIASITDLPTASKDTEGFVYNIESEFTTTADFIEGEGKTYPAGTNVVIVNTTGTEYKYDVLAGMVDLSNYATIDTLNTGLSNKLDKITTTSTNDRAYVISKSGTQTTRDLSSDLSNDTIAVRTATGTLRVQTPTDNNDATTKKYVDDMVGNINTILATMFNDVEVAE